MKKSFFYSLGCCAIAFVGISCSEDDTNDLQNVDETTAIQVESQIQAAEEMDFGMVQDAAIKHGFHNNNSEADTSMTFENCVDLTIDTSSTFPRTITLDFGEGCTDKYGVTRKGILRITYHNYLFASGKVITISRENYSVNDWKIEGDVVYSNVSADNTIKWERTFAEGKITRPDGKSFTHNGTRTVAFTKGLLTEDTQDNEFMVQEGTHSITGEFGTFSTTIIEPLLVKRNCKYITKGKLELKGSNINGTLDYGDGTCDDKATFTNSDGESTEITLGQ